MALVQLRLAAASHPVAQGAAEGVTRSDVSQYPWAPGAKLGRVLVVDLNADVGDGAAAAPAEAALVGLVTSVSIGCGAHAGSAEDMLGAARAALSAGVVTGAHPSYPDRAGFGRRPMQMPDAALADSLERQVAALDEVVRSCGGALRYLKPHGALYHRACAHGPTALLVAQVARAAGIGVVLLEAGAPAADAARASGVEVVGEAFVDRGYLPDGTLVPRHEAGAVIADEERAVEQALALCTEGRAPCVDGGWVAVRASSLCLHGDTPAAWRLARRVRRALEDAGVLIASFVS